MKNTSIRVPSETLNRFLLTVLLIAILSVGCAPSTSYPSVIPVVPKTQESPLPVNTDMILNIQASDESSAYLTDVASKFNEKYSGKYSVVVVSSDNLGIIKTATTNVTAYDAIAPESSMWLTLIDYEFEKNNPIKENSIPFLQSPYTSMFRFGYSPVVIGVWKNTQSGVISWDNVVDGSLGKWAHTTTNYSSGIVSTIAEMYYVAGLSRGLNVSIFDDQSKRDQLSKIEETISSYGDSEWNMLLKMNQAENPLQLDALVMTEKNIFRWNNGSDRKLTALYPKEGTMWVDYPVALLATATDEDKVIFDLFKEFTESVDMQKLTLQYGYRPVSMIVPFVNDKYTSTKVDNLLNIPSLEVVLTSKDLWQNLKKPADTTLVIDLSGSMSESVPSGDIKINVIREAVKAYVNGMSGKNDRLSIIVFANTPKTILEFTTLDTQDKKDKVIALIDEEINREHLSGGTALFESAEFGYNYSRDNANKDSSHVTILMTDGVDTASSFSLNHVQTAIKESMANNPVCVHMFTIAFGQDEGIVRNVDSDSLKGITNSTNFNNNCGGMYFSANGLDIINIYKVLSEYF